MQKKPYVPIQVTPLEKTIKGIEVNMRSELVNSGTIPSHADLRLIPVDGMFHYLLFISDNNVTTQNHSVSIRVRLESGNIDIDDSRVTENIEDYVFSPLQFTNVYMIEQVLGEFGDVLATYRIKLDIEMPMFLSGYNDFIDDNSEKVRFPMFSERKFKLYSTLEMVQKMTAVINSQHPNINVTWI